MKFTCNILPPSHQWAGPLLAMLVLASVFTSICQMAIDDTVPWDITYLIPGCHLMQCTMNPWCHVWWQDMHFHGMSRKPHHWTDNYVRPTSIFQLCLCCWFWFAHAPFCPFFDSWVRGLPFCSLFSRHTHTAPDSASLHPSLGVLNFLTSMSCGGRGASRVYTIGTSSPMCPGGCRGCRGFIMTSWF